jgi:WD40 repeat protein
VISPVYCNGGKTLAALFCRDGIRKGAVALWDLRKGAVQKTLEKFDNLSLSFGHVTASRDGSTIAAAANIGTEGEIRKFKGTVRVWEARTGKLLRTFTVPGQLLYGIALSGDGRKLACGNHDSGAKVCVWEVKTGKLLSELRAKGIEYSSVAFSSDGRWVVGVGAGGLRYLFPGNR